MPPDELPEQLSDEELVDAGDADWLEHEVSRDVDEVTSYGLRVDRDDEIIRRAFQLGDDGLWHRSPTVSRFVEIARALRTLPLLSVYEASSCRTVTVFAERREAPNEEAAQAAEAARRYADRFRAALVDAGAELDSVPTGHYPHVEAPELTVERFDSWLGF